MRETDSHCRHSFALVLYFHSLLVRWVIVSTERWEGQYQETSHRQELDPEVHLLIIGSVVDTFLVAVLTRRSRSNDLDLVVKTRSAVVAVSFGYFAIVNAHVLEALLATD